MTDQEIFLSFVNYILYLNKKYVIFNKEILPPTQPGRDY